MLYQHITVNNISFEGYSIAGVASSIKWSNTDMLFDIGIYDSRFLHTKHLFLSHTHGDHVTGIFQLIADRCLHSIKDTLFIYVPKEVKEEFKSLLLAYNKITQITPRYEVVGVSNGEEIDINSKYRVKFINVTHTVPSIGFIVYEKRKALKKEYKDLTGQEIASLSNKGIVVNEEKIINLVTYIGDSTYQTLYDHPEAGWSKVLFVEATYIDDFDRAKKGGHTELHHLVDPFSKFLNTDCHVVIKHTSNRYTKEFIKSKVEEILKNNVHNITLFMSQTK